MSVGTTFQSAMPQGFLKRDMRDPAVLGWALLVRREGKGAPLSEVYDRDAPFLERVPSWEGDGLMSNDPTQHHSNHPHQTGDSSE